MNRIEYPPFRRAPHSFAWAALASTLLWALPLKAQSGAAPASPEQAVKLKPFEVTDQKTSGYQVSTSSTATRANVARLSEYGYHIFGPEKGELASGKNGWGRLMDTAEIIKRACALTAKRR